MALIVTAVQLLDYKKARTRASRGLPLEPHKLAFLASAAIEGLQLFTNDPSQPFEDIAPIDNKTANQYCQQLIRHLITTNDPKLWIDAIHTATKAFSGGKYATGESSLEKKIIVILQEKINALAAKYQAYLDYLGEDLTKNDWYGTVKPNAPVKIIMRKNAQGEMEIGMVGTDKYYDNLITNNASELKRRMKEAENKKKLLENDKTLTSHEGIVRAERLSEDLTLDKTFFAHQTKQLSENIPLEQREFISNVYPYFVLAEDGNNFGIFQNKYNATGKIITELQKPAATLTEATSRLRTFVSMTNEHAAIVQNRDPESMHILRAIIGIFFTIGLASLVSKIRRGTAEFWQTEGRKVLAETEKLDFGFQYKQ